MLNLDCKDCDGVCCTSKKDKLFVVLTPQEADKFEGFYDKLKTKNGKLNVLKQDQFGNCIFHDENKNICKIYSNRPFDCTAYPYMIHFDKEIDFRLENICPKIESLSQGELEQTKQKWLNQNLPLSWIKAYSEIIFREENKHIFTK
jgi:Fe-S-cluster containining protein